MLSRAIKLSSSRMSLLTSATRSASSFNNVGQDFDLDSLDLARAEDDLLLNQPWSTRPFLTN